MCSEKRRKQKRDWNKKNIHRMRVWNKAWRQRNPEQTKEYRRRSKIRFPERFKAHSVKRREQWKLNHPEKHRTIIKNWEMRNPDRVKLSRLCNSAMRRDIMHRPTDAQKKRNARTYRRAIELREWFDVVVDHIIPLSRGGLHVPSNLQIIYRYENCAKSASLRYKPRVIFA